MSKIKAAGRSGFPEETTQGEPRTRFIADAMLGKLARWLRAFGCDTWYFCNLPTGELLSIHTRSERVLLTRDTALAWRRDMSNFVFIRHDLWEGQIKEVLQALSLRFSRELLFSRCLRCNDLLTCAEPGDVRRRVPDYTAGIQHRFLVCSSCGRVFWPGTHRAEMSRVMERFFLET